ncbi:hypothetical protein GF367_03000 [Candidatus Woesearchaeota archaeon]|nr:hypothetical protein [Candidatus Woesearchaeota archaeon]
MRFVALLGAFLALGVLLVGADEVSLLDGAVADADADGVIDDYDACPGTPAGTTIVDPSANVAYAGCTCDQVGQLIDTTNPCYSFFCFGTVLELSERPYDGPAVDCPDDYCDGFTLFDFPPGGYPRCIDGEVVPYSCDPTVVVNASACGYVPPSVVNVTTPPGNTTGDTTTLPPQNITAAPHDRLVVNASGNAPPGDGPIVSSAINFSVSAAGTRPVPVLAGDAQKFLLTDSEVTYVLPDTILQDGDATVDVLFVTRGRGRRFDPTLADDRGRELSLVNVSCAEDEEATFFCLGEWVLPTDDRGEQEISLHFVYDEGGGEIIEEDLAIPFIVAPQPFAPRPSPRAVVAVADGAAAVFEPQETFLVEAVHEELVEQELTDQDVGGFAERIQETVRYVAVEKGSVYDEGKNTTTFSLSVEPDEGIFAENVSVIEYVPKAVAATADEIVFSVPPTRVLRDDPLIMWHFAAVEERVDISYEVKGEVQATGNTIVAAESLQNGTSPWFIVVPMLMIPLIVLLLIGLPRLVRKHHEERPPQR